MKEQILETLSDLGFKLEEADNFGYSFTYEGINYLYMPADDDDNFLSITIPGIYDIDEDNPLQGHLLIDKINSTLKYIKAYVLGDRIWLFYERELIGDEELDKVVSRMILRLDAALDFARKEINAEDNNNEEDTEE